MERAFGGVLALSQELADIADETNEEATEAALVRAREAVREIHGDMTTAASSVLSPEEARVAVDALRLILDNRGYHPNGPSTSALSAIDKLRAVASSGGERDV